MGLITTFRARQAPGFWWSLVSALIAIAVGLILLAEPITGAVSLTLVLIVFFVVEGVATIMYALEHRRELSGRWEWMLVSGIIDLVLAGIIFAGLPGTAAWALGLLVGHQYGLWGRGAGGDSVACPLGRSGNMKYGAAYGVLSSGLHAPHGRASVPHVVLRSLPAVADCSHSRSFDQRRRPETLRTAMATAFFWPTRTTSRLPRVTPV
jgi:hypothetical protein